MVGCERFEAQGLTRRLALGMCVYSGNELVRDELVRGELAWGRSTMLLLLGRGEEAQCFSGAA